jgi:hypothetical protein
VVFVRVRRLISLRSAALLQFLLNFDLASNRAPVRGKRGTALEELTGDRRQEDLHGASGSECRLSTSRNQRGPAKSWRSF